MTSLGEFTASVAHELNQPLKNVKLDINNLPQDLKGDVEFLVEKTQLITN